MFGEVYRVFDKSTRKFFAVKEISPHSYSKDDHIQKVAQLEMYNLSKVQEYTQGNEDFLQIYSNQYNM